MATVTTSKVLRKIEAAFSNNPLASVASVAKSLHLRKELFRNLRRRLLGIKACKKKTVPKYINNQETRASFRSVALALTLALVVMIVIFHIWTLLYLLKPSSNLY